LYKWKGETKGEDCVLGKKEKMLNPGGGGGENEFLYKREKRRKDPTKVLIKVEWKKRIGRLL